jgi:MYXO-CTERM domain-containing protein
MPMSPVRIALQVLFALCILIGFIWIGQGSGHFPYPASSFMIDQTPWIFYGAALAAVGLFGLFRLRRR